MRPAVSIPAFFRNFADAGDEARIYQFQLFNQLSITVNVKNIILPIICCLAAFASDAQNNIAEEVAWMIGDQPIFKSDIEEMYQQYQSEGIPIKGDPYCVLPERIALQRLFLHQAELDTIEVPASRVQSQVEAQINYLISNLGSKEKVEQYFNRSIPDLRNMYYTQINDMQREQMVKNNLTKNIKVTPRDVVKFYEGLAEDSIPSVPMKVGVQIITLNPTVPQQEIDNVKARLRDYAERVNNGEADFYTLAVLYSEAPEGVRGGEIGFMGRAQLVPEYAAVAFNLSDPKKVSKIVETEYGFHIIQLIEKRGDRVNTRHILLKPKVAQKDLETAIERLDSLRADIVDNKKLTFEEGARIISQDKDTRLSNGVMTNENGGSTLFEMGDLPPEIARAVASMQPGEISMPFVMKDERRNREQVAIVKLTTRVDAHKANLSDDFQLLKNMYENKEKQQIINKWIEKKIAETYVKIEDGWAGCEFEHEGWIKK